MAIREDKARALALVLRVAAGDDAHFQSLIERWLELDNAVTVTSQEQIEKADIADAVMPRLIKTSLLAF